MEQAYEAFSSLRIGNCVLLWIFSAFALLMWIEHLFDNYDYAVWNGLDWVVPFGFFVVVIQS